MGSYRLPFHDADNVGMIEENLLVLTIAGVESVLTGEGCHLPHKVGILDRDLISRIEGHRINPS
jgi:hypothetical protein